MVNNSIKIKQRRLSERCEICHQADYFNPKTEECERCSKLNLKLVSIDDAISQYIFNKVFMTTAVTGVLCILVAICFTFFFEFKILIVPVISIAVGFMNLCLFLHYQYRCRKLIRLVKNIQPISIEFILKEVALSSNSKKYYVELNSNKSTSIQLLIHPPPWDVSSILNKPYSALAYFDKNAGFVLQLDKGFLISLGSKENSLLMNHLQK